MASPRSFFITTSWNKGAVAQQFIGLARELGRRGHRLRVLVTGDSSRAQGDGFEVSRFPSARPTGLADARFLAGLIRLERPDVIIANFGATNVSLLVGAALRVPTRVTWYHTISTANREDARVPPWRVRLLELRKAVVYRAATHVVANSEAARRDAIDTFWVPERKISFFYNSIPEPPPAGSIVERSTNKLVCVGRLSSNKGQRTVIEALARMNNRVATVTFVGDGPIRGELEQLAETLGVRHRCIFAGYYIAPDLWREVRTATACVVPSLYEAFGLVSVEAMAVSTPLVVSATGGSVEIARNEREALHFPPGDADALARQLDRLLADAELQERLGRAGRARFVDLFEQTAAVKRLATWCEQITEQRS